MFYDLQLSDNNELRKPVMAAVRWRLSEEEGVQTDTWNFVFFKNSNQVQSNSSVNNSPKSLSVWVRVCVRACTAAAFVSTAKNIKTLSH